jgi:hypothetical protein
MIGHLHSYENLYQALRTANIDKSQKKIVGTSKVIIDLGRFKRSKEECPNYYSSLLIFQKNREGNI